MKENRWLNTGKEVAQCRRGDVSNGGERWLNVGQEKWLNAGEEITQCRRRDGSMQE
jgi:hypothetical protein